MLSPNQILYRFKPKELLDWLKLPTEAANSPLDKRITPPTETVIQDIDANPAAVLSSIDKYRAEHIDV